MARRRLQTARGYYLKPAGDALRDRIWQALHETPGLHVYALACRLGTSSTGILNALVGLERCGRLLYEDDRGRLYPFHDN